MDRRDGEMISAEEMEARVVRYGDLRPCYNAFIDTRSPGSEAKENFTIIGPGVSENPHQHVHIAEPHGYNVGGARQPPNCVNSQHSHETAEVFVVHSGRWRFDLGETGEDAQVEIGPGDVISLPTRTFRGFTNVGEESGFLWAVLGGDDPGRVTWAPQVFDMAKDFGLVLMENGSLIDTVAGETLPSDVSPMPPTTAEQAGRLRRYAQAQAESFVLRAARMTPQGEALVIGEGAPLGWPHGFTLSRLTLARGEQAARATRSEPEVLFVHQGALSLTWSEGRSSLGTGDTITVPAGLQYAVTSDQGAVVYAVRRDARASAAKAA